MSSQECYAIGDGHGRFLTKSLKDFRKGTIGPENPNLSDEWSKIRIFGTEAGAERTRINRSGGHSYLGSMKVIPITVTVEPR